MTYIDKCGIAFCVFGSLMFLISFMGCCGALKQIKCLLGMYSFILLLLLLAEIGIGIFAAVYSVKLKEVLTPLLKESVRTQYSGDMQNKTLVSVAWDALMYNVYRIHFNFKLSISILYHGYSLCKFECCGANNYSDFDQSNNVWTDRGSSLIPRACCKVSYFYSSFI